ncbi:endonuclease III [Oscillatoria amoena NRMC-F 0135]|nr:endonuclease III [Oscillatoria laete-virens]MDL5048660.1 endonuclease III [Oscillatoria amoena NRMC-F 0135]MDL5053247.1 endonuclease III [Oscillatoria laete-virens NRMC-F 0139]
MTPADRASRILDTLKRVYPQAHCELNHSNPLELLVATILSAQCTDKRVNLVTPALFARYRDVGQFARAGQEELEGIIRSTGFYRNKARNIIACCRMLVEKHGGEIPRGIEALAELPGVGRKTANVVLGNAFGINEGVVVDTHVSRLSQRMGLTRQKTPEKIERALMKLYPSSQWCDLSHYLIWHGRNRCDARKPDCANCEVGELCASRSKLLKAAALKKK